MKLDNINKKILEILQANSRTQMTDIAKKVGTSSPTIADRIAKMEQACIIEGYSTKINLSNLGYTLTVFISIKIRFGMVEEFTKFIKTVPEITECYKLTGNDCMQMRAYVKNSYHLDDLNIRLTRYGQLTTSILLDTIVDNRILLDKLILE